MTPQAKKQILYIFIVLAAGLLLTSLLLLTKKKPQRKEQEVPGPLVEVVEAGVRSVPVAVRGQGTVRAKVSAQIVPQVSGKVVSVSPRCVDGGRFRAGEVLFAIEAADYEMAVVRAEAAVARARVQVEMEAAEAEVAKAEWERLHPKEPLPSGLVAREPQIAQARAELQAAEADLETARLNLDRTKIAFPFDGVVLEERVNPGEFLAAGQPAGSVYAAGVLEIPVPVGDEELAWLPPPTRKGPPSPAVVRTDFAGREQVWEGVLARVEGQVDPVTRMVNLIVEVTPDGRSGDESPLLPGMFVSVEVEGLTLEDVVPVPRRALRQGGRVWILEGDRLRIREAEATRTDRDTAYLRSGVSQGERVVVTTLEAVTDNMKVRVSGEAAQ